MCNQLYLLNFQVIKFISTNISTKKLAKANQYKEQFDDFLVNSTSLYLPLKWWLQKAISALIPANAFGIHWKLAKLNNTSLKDQKKSVSIYINFSLGKRFNILCLAHITHNMELCPLKKEKYIKFPKDVL
jgi:hypothetical protein